MSDFSIVIREARRLAKSIKNNDDYKANLKIAVLGTVSIQYFVMILRYELVKSDINVEIYEGEYDGIAMDALDESSTFYEFHPNMVILMTNYLDVKLFPPYYVSEEDILSCCNSHISYYKHIWKAISKIPGIKILQTNFVYPPEHLLGNLETQLNFSKTSYYRLLNNELVRQAYDYVTIIDLELISEYVGKNNWFDYPSYFLSKSGVRLDYLIDMCSPFVRVIKAMLGKTRKCLVLDLDNTLWGGIIGDLGWNGIQIDPNDAVGEAYRYFQKYVLELKNRGVLLAVCSKNDKEIAMEAFEKNANMILKMEDIACFCANWDDKVTNLKRISKELNIGTDSLVFFDDNPAEREIVSSFLPEVHVVAVPEDPALYVSCLDRENPFDWIQITKEDISRNDTYQMNRERLQLENNYVNYDDYLKALNMKARLVFVDKIRVPRFTQLLNKTNQFNLRTQRYSEEEVFNMLDDGNKKCLAFEFEDKFSYYGIISCVILKKRGFDCFIESWVMSCRVLKRGIEYYVFNKIIEEARKWGCSTISGEYRPFAYISG